MYFTLLITLVNKFKPQISMETSKELKHSFEFISHGTETGLNQAILTHKKCKNYEKRTYVYEIIFLIESLDSVQFMPKMWLLHSAALN